MSKRTEYQDAVGRLHDALIARSRGGSPDEADYRALREYVLETDDLAQRAPNWLRRMRSLEIWWDNIQPMFPSYAERRNYVHNEFEPLFEYIESLPKDGAPLPRPAPTKPPVPQSMSRQATPEEVKKANDEMLAFLNNLAGRAQRPPAPAQQRETQSPKSSSATGSAKPPGQVRVFIVHGHDTNRREAVARYLERLGFDAVILADQPDQGRTIIEKFEAHSDVDYAIVLMTPDDMGGAKGGRARPRARQNVVLELGFFIGILGRKNVVALVVGDIETPSDISGVLYVPWDEGGSWKDRVAREMKAAGLPVDKNRL